MSASESRSGVVLELAEEFLERYRRGERPPLKEYIDRHPELAAEIKEVFPAMALMENIALADDSLTGDATGPALATGAAPQQLGDYRLLREVGRGGMGIVYEAEQVSLGRHVALKVLPRKMFVEEAQRRRFEREAKAAAKLHHTNIVPIFGVGEHDGLPYYVMQFIQGLGLDDVLDELKRMQGSGSETATGGELRVSRKDVSAADVARSLMSGDFQEPKERVESPPPGTSAADAPDGSGTNKLSDSFTLSSSVKLPGSGSAVSGGKGKRATYWQSVANIGVQVAEALEYAHKQGILHRDIKPSNLLLDTRGTVWVTDFGLARAENEDHLTQTGDIVGTLRYMPPEAFEGRSDKRGDIYSLGLTLYELLALKPAYEERDRHRLIKRVTTEEPTRLDKLHRAIPRDLVTIVHKAIDREPARRYATAAELSADLQRFLDDEPIHARRTSALERSWRWCRHHPGVATLTAVLAVVLVTVTAASLVIAARLDRLATQREQLAQQEMQTAESERAARRAAEEAKDAAEQAKKREAAQRRRMETALHYSHIALAERAWLGNDVRTAERLLDQAEQSLSQPDRRGWEWGYLKGLCHADLLTLTGHRGGCQPYSVAYSPDGRFLVSAARNYYAAHGQPILSEVIIWDARSGQRLHTLDSSGVIRPWSVAYSRDGAYLAVLSDKPYKVWDTRSWEEVAPAKVPDAAFHHPSSLPVHMENDIIRLATASGAKRETLHGHVGRINGIAVSAKGKRLASAGSDQTVRVWDVQSGTQWAIFRGHVNSVNAVVFSPDGSRLASASLDGTIKIWDLGRDPRGLRLAATNGDRGEWLATFAFSSDSQRLDTVACDGPGPCLRTLDTAAGLLLSRRNMNSLNVNLLPAGNRSDFVHVSAAFTLSPGGDRVAGLRRGERAVLSVCDRVTGRELVALRGHTGVLRASAFSPDGRRIATASPSSGEVKLWDAATGKEVVRLEQPVLGRNFRAYALAFSPDGKRLAAGPAGIASPPGIWVWDVASGQRLAVFQPQITFTSCLTFSGEGDKLAAVIGGREVQVLDAATGKQVFVSPRQSDIEGVAFSPDGRRLAGAGRHGGVSLWDADTGQEILTLPRLASPPPGNWGFVARVAFSPDGRRLAANNWDGTISLWTAEDLTPAGRAARLKSAADFAKSVQRKPDDSEVWKERARSYFALGQKDKATAEFRKAVELLDDKAREAVLSEPAVSEADKLLLQLIDDAVLKKLTTDIERNPEDVSKRWQRGGWQARHRRWKEAAADFTTVLQRQPPGDAMQWLYAAPTLVAAGDREGYRRLCREMLKRFGETQDPGKAEQTAKVCLLLPASGKDSDLACQLADRGILLGKNSPVAHWYLFCKGLADYRRGNFRAAIAELDPLVPQSAALPEELLASYHLVMAMAHQRLGEAQAAREHLALGAQLLDQFLPETTLFPKGWNGYNHDWLIAWLLHREAQTLIAGKKAEGKK